MISSQGTDVDRDARRVDRDCKILLFMTRNTRGKETDSTLPDAFPA